MLAVTSRSNGTETAARGCVSAKNIAVKIEPQKMHKKSPEPVNGLNIIVYHLSVGKVYVPVV